jgi:DNA-binding MarR family transcriptional regulator
MDISSGQPLTPQHPGLAEALADPFNRAIWELLRRRARASTVAELSALSLATQQQVGAALARLEALGLVKRAFEPGTRRRTAFKIARERLVIVYNRRDAAQSAAAEAILAQVAEHGRVASEVVEISGIVLETRRAAEKKVAGFQGASVLMQAKRSVDVAGHAFGIQLAQPPAHGERLVPCPRLHQNEQAHLQDRLDLALSRPQHIEFRQRVGGHLEFDIALGRQQCPIE